MQTINEPTQKKDLGIIISVDPVMFSLIDNKLHILLHYRTERENDINNNTWMLPGGVVEKDLDNSLEDALHRVLRIKTGVEVNYVEQLTTMRGIDSRGWTLSTSYIALVSQQKPLNNAKWVALEDLKDYYLGFPHHYQIIDEAVKRLTNKVNYSTLPMHFLEKDFTLPKLQKVYEILLGESLDKSTFRKKIEETGMLKETGELLKEGPYRPAKLYSINKQDIYHFKRNMT